MLLLDGMLLCSLIPLWRKHGLSRQDLGLRAVPALRSAALVILGLVAYVLLAVLWVRLLPTQSGSSLLADVGHQSTINIVLAVVAASISAPVVEEIFFRGLLYRSLRNRLPLIPAVLIAGAMFGLVHITSYPLETLPVKAAFGVIACLLYERTGSLLPGISLHIFVDASAIDLTLTGNDLIVLTAFLVLAITLSGVWVRRNTRPTKLPPQPATATQTSQ